MAAAVISEQIFLRIDVQSSAGQWTLKIHNGNRYIVTVQIIKVIIQ